MFISFFSSSMLHWDRTRPFMLAWEITKSESSAKQDIFFSMYTFSSSQIHTFLIVAVYWESRFWSMPSISLTRSQTTSVLIELSSIDGVPETTEAEPWYTQRRTISTTQLHHNSVHMKDLWSLKTATTRDKPCRFLENSRKGLQKVLN